MSKIIQYSRPTQLDPRETNLKTLKLMAGQISSGLKRTRAENILNIKSGFLSTKLGFIIHQDSLSL